MNNLTTFDFNNNGIRIVEIDGNPWFVSADALKAMGYPVYSHANVRRKLAEDEKDVKPIHTLGGGQKMIIISESGLYKLIMRSDKPEAKAFQDWVTRVVLPAIRKDGGYILGEEKVATGEMSEDELVLKALTVMQTKIERLTTENAVMNEELSAVTIAEYTALNHVYFSQSEKNRLAAKARSLADYIGAKITKSPRVVRTRGNTYNTEVNVYPRDLLDRVACDLGLFEAAQGEVRPVH